MPRPNVDAMIGRPEWLENFQAWVARLSPATIADLIDVVALELREQDVGEHPALGETADMVRAHQLVRVQQLVDDFLLVPAHTVRARSTSEAIPGEYRNQVFTSASVRSLEVVVNGLACLKRGDRGTVCSPQGAAHVPVPNVGTMFGRPDWLESFQAWVARLSSATLADLIDVLALELREREVGDHQVLTAAAETLRTREGVRVQQVVDPFLVESPSASGGQWAIDGFQRRLGGSI